MICRFPNPELYGQAIEYARIKGVPVYYGTNKDSYADHPCLVFYKGNYLCADTGEMNWIEKSKVTEIFIPEFFQMCDNWIKCGSKPSEGEYLRPGDKVKVRDHEDDEWESGYAYLLYEEGNSNYPYIVRGIHNNTEKQEVGSERLTITSFFLSGRIFH